jgi:hypothetical protein
VTSTTRTVLTTPTDVIAHLDARAWGNAHMRMAVSNLIADDLYVVLSDISERMHGAGLTALSFDITRGNAEMSDLRAVLEAAGA